MRGRVVHVCGSVRVACAVVPQQRVHVRPLGPTTARNQPGDADASHDEPADATVDAAAEEAMNADIDGFDLVDLGALTENQSDAVDRDEKLTAVVHEQNRDRLVPYLALACAEEYSRLMGGDILERHIGTLTGQDFDDRFLRKPVVKTLVSRAEAVIVENSRYRELRQGLDAALNALRALHSATVKATAGDTLNLATGPKEHVGWDKADWNHGQTFTTVRLTLAEFKDTTGLEKASPDTVVVIKAVGEMVIDTACVVFKFLCWIVGNSVRTLKQDVPASEASSLFAAVDALQKSLKSVHHVITSVLGIPLLAAVGCLDCSTAR